MSCQDSRSLDQVYGLLDVSGCDLADGELFSLPIYSEKVGENGAFNFGRFLAAILFGSGARCALINKKFKRRVWQGCFSPTYDQRLEKLFQDCVEQKFHDDKEVSVMWALLGANSYGSEMRRKYPEEIQSQGSQTYSGN